MHPPQDQSEEEDEEEADWHPVSDTFGWMFILMIQLILLILDLYQYRVPPQSSFLFIAFHKALARMPWLTP